MLSYDFQPQTYPVRTRRLSEGVFWFFIAATILLALLDARLPMQAPLSPSAAWAGVFVLYYALRSSFTLPGWRSAHQAGWAERRSWLQWWSSVPLPLLFDLLVMTSLLALSGGWASPLYLLYLGWAAALLDEPSTVICFVFTALACGAFGLGVLLAPHQPFSALQIRLLAEHLLLLLLVALGISGIKVYIKHMKSAWEVERRQWDALRQTVFAHLSHELYTPLSAMSASTALLRASEGSVADRQQQLLHVIERNCARMSVLIDDLLALWREQRRQLDYIPEGQHCLTIAASAGQMLSPLLEGKQQSLVMLAQPEDVCALADRQRLEQVLVNLLANAQKYGPAGAAITLTICSQGQEVLFAVHDEGAGVPLEEQRHLFELFYRGTKSAASARGSGIGLALAKALVVLQGGRIWVESLPGRGSTFYFTLPAVDPG